MTGYWNYTKQVQSHAKSPFFEQKQFGGAANSSDRMRLGAGDFHNLPSQPFKAQYNEMLYTDNKIHMISKGRLMLSFSKHCFNFLYSKF